MPVAKNATISDVRAPYITRTNKSRPALSAPNQKLPFGPWGRPNAFVISRRKTWFGPWPNSSHGLLPTTPRAGSPSVGGAAGPAIGSRTTLATRVPPAHAGFGSKHYLCLRQPSKRLSTGANRISPSYTTAPPTGDCPPPKATVPSDDRRDRPRSGEQARAWGATPEVPEAVDPSGSRTLAVPHTRIKPASRGTMSTPRNCPRDPVAHARSPNDVEPSGRIGPPLASRGTGSAVCALRTHDVEWSAVTATMVRLPSIIGRTSPKKARSITSMTSRLSSERPSWAGTSGPLMCTYRASKPSRASEARLAHRA